MLLWQSMIGTAPPQVREKTVQDPEMYPDEPEAAGPPQAEPADAVAPDTPDAPDAPAGPDALATPAAPDARATADASTLLNREISLLRFFFRVLEEAQDESIPLLERVKFLSILGSILSEFFMVRVAGLKQQVAAGISDPSPDGLSPAEQLRAIRPMVEQLMGESRTCFAEVLHQLADVGVHVVDYERLTDEQQRAARAYFDDVVFPVLTPLAHDPARPFPFISNMSLNLAVILRRDDGTEQFARVKVPNTLPRLIPVPSGTDGRYLVWLEQVVAAHLAELFPGVEIVEAHPFRITRDADIAIQELEAADLLETVEHFVRRRRFGSVVRLVVDRGMPDYIRSILTRELEIGPDDVYQVDLPLAMSTLGCLYDLDRPDLKDPSFIPRAPVGLEGVEGTEVFSAIRQQDILLHHPYESFEPVVDLLETAARDPDVLAIKQTLYRVGRNAPVVAALLQAARNGKEVAVLVELKARFDEESNIEWARTLEREGVHVVYGLIGLKTHCKVLLVVRREGSAIRRYVHLSTGNYNTVTTKQYTDVGLFTANEAFGEDASDLFNYLTGYSKLKDYRKLRVAPMNLRESVEQLIRREMEFARNGETAYLILKLNSLVDKKMIGLLYEASQVGVKQDLLVRGICCLRPQVPGLSENIKVTSIVGRFLEHSRIYYFHNGGSEECYLSSADLMPRNLDRRVETLFPIEDPALVRRLREEILETYMRDDAKARHMQPDGTYIRAKPAGDGSPCNAQEWLLAGRSAGATGSDRP
jgi:polyphosphate kinase